MRDRLIGGVRTRGERERRVKGNKRGVEGLGEGGRVIYFVVSFPGVFQLLYQYPSALIPRPQRKEGNEPQIGHIT